MMLGPSVDGLGQVCVRVSENPEDYGACLEYEEPIGPQPLVTEPMLSIHSAASVVCQIGTLGDNLCTAAEIKRGISDGVLTWGAIALIGLGIVMVTRR